MFMTKEIICLLCDRSVIVRWRYFSACSPTLPLIYLFVYSESSVTRYGDLLDFGQVFKAFGNN